MKDWRNKDTAKRYLTGIRGAIPLADIQLDVIGRIVKNFQPDLRNFIDLGCGDGILGRYVQDLYPHASGIYIDYSEPMLSELKKKLRKESLILYEDYSRENWLNLIADKKPFNLVISGFSIHHMPDSEKKKIYKNIYDLLDPGGLFLNLEHVASITPEVENIHDDLFIDSLFEYNKNSKTKDIIRSEYKNREDKALNILASAEVQCGWLKDIGFNNVDCFFKIFELAIFGGTKQ